MKAVEQMEENGLDLTRCPFSSPFLCTQQLRLPLPQHCQSLTVTLFHFAVWLSCLSSSCSDKWNWTGLAGGSWHDERAFRGEKCRSDPAAFSKGYSGLKTSQPREGWVSPSLASSVSVPRPRSRFISDVQELGGDFKSGLLFFLDLIVYLHSPTSSTKRKKRRKKEEREEMGNVLWLEKKYAKTESESDDLAQSPHLIFFTTGSKRDNYFKSLLAFLWISSVSF